MSYDRQIECNDMKHELRVTQNEDKMARRHEKNFLSTHIEKKLQKMMILKTSHHINFADRLKKTPSSVQIKLQLKTLRNM